MNRILFISAFLLAVTAHGVIAQKTDKSASADSTKAKADSVSKRLFNQRAKSIYLEAFGAGVYYSVNYDIRFSKKQNGLGGRIGIEYFQGFNQGTTFALPIGINYLFGKRSRYFELGVIALPYYHKGTSDYELDLDNYLNDMQNGKDVHIEDYYKRPSPYGAFISASVGYRYQPLKGGLNFGVGANVISNFTHRVLP